MQILHLLVQSWVTGTVQTLHVPALSWYIVQIRLLTALFRQFFIQVGEEAHHSLVYLVVNLLLDGWSDRSILMVDLTIVEMVNLW